MKFLVDAQLPPVLARWLRDDGHEADHVANFGLATAADTVIADLAESTDAVLISKDADFVMLRRPDRFGLVWLRCGNASNPELRAWLTPRWPLIFALLLAGERLVEAQ